MDERKERILRLAEEWVKEAFQGEGSGHDVHHVLRVRDTAMRIHEEERKGDPFRIELGALLHDVGDPKLHDGDPEAGRKTLERWVRDLGLEKDEKESVLRLVEHVSFKGSGVKDQVPDEETAIVQDADRLDAIGAIGIARTFAFGGSRGRPIHLPEEGASGHDSYDAYLRSQSPTIAHFHEKLLLLKDRMKTPAGRRIAEERHRFMERFLERFHKEWEGKA